MTYEPSWRIVVALRRWIRIRQALGLTWHPSNLLLNPRSRNVVERARVIRCVERWMEISEAHGRQVTAYDFWLSASHSGLLQWLLSGNEPLPFPPPCRFAYPDHAMIFDGQVTVREIWKFNQEGRIVVDQESVGWTLVRADHDDLRVASNCELNHQTYGRWYFQREVRSVPYKNREGGTSFYEDVLWVGTSDYRCAAAFLGWLLG